MNADSKSARSIFLAAVDEASGEDRTRYVEAVCDGDEDLRHEVLRLLHAHGHLNSFMQIPAAGPAPTVGLDPSERVGATIARYKLLEQIGEGGMGLVYVAEQSEPVRRRVALKVIKPGMDTCQVIGRFEAERQALALMDHPHIAKVYDAGATEAGRPYFVMELVRGMPITEYSDQAQIDVRRRLELFITVCNAVQHAHQKGVIHRDIKPSNVLVTLHDGQPVVKVIDFGVAKAINQQLTERTLYTAFSELIGTPLYMSPEQAELSGLDIDTRSDVYSLGVLLYELLTGRTPFDLEVLAKSGLDEVRRIIRQEEPARPSHRISTLKAAEGSTVSQRRGIDQRQLTRTLSGELDWIVMKALEKDRNRRYESASAFAADIGRYLKNQPIEASPPSAIYRFGKFARRKRGLLIAASLGVAVLLLAIAGLTFSSLLIARERDSAVAARNQATDNFQLARDAVDKLITRVADEQLFNVPRMEQLRKSLLADALDFYRQMLTRDSDNPSLQHEMARAQMRVADLLRALGRRNESVTAQNDAINRLRILIARDPQSPEYNHSLAEALCGTGRQREVEEAVLMMESLKREYPDRADYQLGLAQAYRALAWLEAAELASREAFDDRTKALALFKQAQDLVEPIACSPHAILAHKALYARLLSEVGVALAPAEEGRGSLQAAERILRELISLDAASWHLRVELVDALWNRSQLYLASDQEEDLAIRREILSLSEELAEDFPDMPRHRRSLAWCHIVVGNAYIVPRIDGARFEADPTAALRHYRCAQSILKALIEEDPDEQANYDILAPALGCTAWLQWKHASTEAWLHAEDEYRTVFLERANAFDEPQQLFWAAYHEWDVSRRLIETGLHSEAREWAHDAFQHFRALLTNAHAFSAKTRLWLSAFPAELRNGGFHDEAKEFDASIRPLLKAPLELGAYEASSGNHQQAIQHYQTALTGEPHNHAAAMEAAFLLLASDERTGYENLCRELLARCDPPEDGTTARHTSLTCLIGVPPVGDLKQLTRLADLAVEEARTAVIEPVESDARGASFFVRGLAAYRAADFDGAVAWCSQSRQLAARHFSVAQNLYVEAMALHEMGAIEDANAAFDQAATLNAHACAGDASNPTELVANWPDAMLCDLLRREATALLRSPAGDRSSRSGDDG